MTQDSSSSRQGRPSEGGCGHARPDSDSAREFRKLDAAKTNPRTARAWARCCTAMNRAEAQHTKAIEAALAQFKAECKEAGVL